MGSGKDWDGYVNNYSEEQYDYAVKKKMNVMFDAVAKAFNQTTSPTYSSGSISTPQTVSYITNYPSY